MCQNLVFKVCARILRGYLMRKVIILIVNEREIRVSVLFCRFSTEGPFTLASKFACAFAFASKC